MRRDIELGPDDVRALDALGLSWETFRTAEGTRYLIVHSHSVPRGYNHAEVKVAIRLDTYPPGPLDMAYVFPPLARADGRTINNLTTLTIQDETWQQWSRHYAFRVGVDTLGSHLRRFRSWLTHEFRKR